MILCSGGPKTKESAVQKIRLQHRLRQRTLQIGHVSITGWLIITVTYVHVISCGSFPLGCTVLRVLRVVRVLRVLALGTHCV